MKTGANLLVRADPPRLVQLSVSAFAWTSSAIWFLSFLNLPIKLVSPVSKYYRRNCLICKRNLSQQSKEKNQNSRTSKIDFFKSTQKGETLKVTYILHIWSIKFVLKYIKFVHVTSFSSISYFRNSEIVLKAILTLESQCLPSSVKRFSW